LRRKLRETTSGLNSATILIADKRGREELVRALQTRPGGLGVAVGSKPRTEAADEPAAPSKRLDLRSIRNWLELLLPVIVGASLLFFVESRF
jgi:hypothetical protein